MPHGDYLITGGTGTLGSSIVERLISTGIEENQITIFSRTESKQQILRKKFPDCIYVLGDVTDLCAVLDVTRNKKYVIHAAATKFVDIGEIMPTNVANINILGSLNVLKACIINRVDSCIAISTDKACEPLNVYGMSKQIMERMWLEHFTSVTKFKIVRYGNVLGSTGSVIPIWKNQVSSGKDITITNPEMTRFVFTVNDAVDLIFDCLNDGSPGEVWGSKMKAVKLKDLAEVMANGKVKIVKINTRSGEKEHETLFSENEMSQTEIKGNYIIYRPNYTSPVKSPAYVSSSVLRMSKKEIKEVFINNDMWPWK